MPVDPRATSGFAADADAYDRVRPGWPHAAVAAAVRAAGVTRASRVVDLAAGTGKLTRALAPFAGAVVAVEPSAPMRRVLAASGGAAEVLDGTAEELPIADASADAVFVGEAFHWFDATAAANEIARVLRPGGALALLWNREIAPLDPPRWRAVLDELLAPYRAAAGPFPAPQEAPALDSRFSPWEHAAVEHRHELVAEELAALVGTRSWIANLRAAEREAVLARVRSLADEHVTLVYRAEVHVTRLVVA